MCIFLFDGDFDLGWGFFFVCFYLFYIQDGWLKQQRQHIILKNETKKQGLEFYLTVWFFRKIKIKF